MISRLKTEAGYSLVEVMASIMILTIAIIPMVGMFDAGLNAASTSGNYDRARTFANKQLERAKSFSYADVEDYFPGAPGAANAADMPGGASNSVQFTSTASPGNAAPHDVPTGMTYAVCKRYLQQPDSASASDTLGSAATTDTGLIEVKVTVGWEGATYNSTACTWSGGNTYSTTAVVAGSG